MINETVIESSATSGRLFSVGQIVLATVLGTPLAGSLLVAQNYRVLQRSRAVWQSIGCGLASTIILFVVAFLLPEKFPNSVLPVAYCIAMRQLVSYLQGNFITRHLVAGGGKGSWAIAAVVGIICLVILLAVVFALFMLYALLS